MWYPSKIITSFKQRRCEAEILAYVPKGQIVRESLLIKAAIRFLMWSCYMLNQWNTHAKSIE